MVDAPQLPADRDDVEMTDVASSPQKESIDENTAKAGSYAILFGSIDMVLGLRLTPGEILNCRLGTFSHDDMIGRPFGSLIRERDPWLTIEKKQREQAFAKQQEQSENKAASSSPATLVSSAEQETRTPSSLSSPADVTTPASLPKTASIGVDPARIRRPYLTLLKANPELLTLSCEHRTQIIYHADISLILALLDAKPGARIAESGTGSGSLSSALGDAVRPDGRVFTYEFHSERAENVRKKFAITNYLDVVRPFEGSAYETGSFRKGMQEVGEEVGVNVVGWSVTSAEEIF